MKAGAIVLITGGTGSFGSTLARRLLTPHSVVGEVRILSRDEAKQDDLRRWLKDSRARFYVGDVRDLVSVREAMSGVDHVFHAAALKQVPSCEFFPMQAVATNVAGSANVIQAAHEAGVKSVVCLSTDKAVYPINAMGMSKALMEKVAFAFARNHPESLTTVSVTRYGNVMMSRGSVIPLFMEQVRSQRPITVTDPTMTRFLMSLGESVDLVKHAWASARPGDLFVRKTPAATMGDLALAVGEVAGVKANVEVIGVRHGEKAHESLIASQEMERAEDHGLYYRVPLDGRSLNYGMYLDQGSGTNVPVESYTSDNAERLTVEGIVERLRALPEFAS